MPRGRYVLTDPYDGQPLGVERFSCAPGPGGWRYMGERSDSGSGHPTGGVDLTLDGSGRQVRVEVRAGGWVLRGGVVGPRGRWARLPGSAAWAGPAGAAER
ncbi:MAG TPA: hypothetical protein VKP11_08160, partial [Frankiaceae bacterium]|nr:hypothetical protein [Frankiaceae bacterium]